MTAGTRGLSPAEPGFTAASAGTRGLSPAEPGFTAAPCGVVGASARAAVHSLARAGLSAWAVDLFADRDLERVADSVVCPLDRYPDALPELAAKFPPGPVLYTGGLENHPHVVRELTATRELWGNPPEVLARVRDPFTLFPALARAGFTSPRLVPPGEPCPAEGRWLRKPLRSGGGLGIRLARPGEAASPQHYFQEFIDGTPMSALFVSGALVGVTEQLIGEPRLHARPFAYCGNVGPAALPPATLDQLARFGEEARAGFALRGPWGLDFLHDGTTPRPAELNPRYTASVEVLEFATGATVWDDPFPASWAIPRPWRGPGTVGKAIYYAPHAIRFPQSGPWDADLAGEFDPWRLPGFADIPDHGGVIEPGSPVLTFFAGGSTPAEVRERLQSRAAELDTLFRSASP